MRLTKKKIFTIISVFILALIAYASYSYRDINRQYAHAESRLKEEMASLNLPSEFQPQSSAFRPGICLDNCPMLRNVYKVNGMREQFGQILKQKLEARGYEVRYSAGRVSTPAYNNVSFYSNTEPELRTGTKGYENNLAQQTQLVSTITVSLSYTP